MAYTAMTNDVYIANIPAVTNENNRAIQQDRIVDAGKLNGNTAGNTSGQIAINNGTLCTNLNAEKLGGNLASAFAAAAHVHAVATGSSNGLMSNSDFIKLLGIAVGAEVNQNAFSNILVGTTTIAADSKTDTLEIVAGTNILLTPDATNDKLTIAVTGTVANATNATYATTAGSAPANGGTAATISGTITGNQVLSARSNIATDVGTAKELRWNKFGSNYTIVDNSDGSYGTSVTDAVNPWVGNYPTLMGYNGTTTYGVRVDSSRLADYLKVISNNECVISNGFASASGLLYVNYRGATVAITDYRLCDGMAAGALANVIVSKAKLGDSNTALNKGSNNSARITTPSGYAEIGAQNANYCHYYTDRAQNYFDKPILILGKTVATTDQIPTTLPANGGTSASCSGNSATATKSETNSFSINSDVNNLAELVFSHGIGEKTKITRQATSNGGIAGSLNVVYEPSGSLAPFRAGDIFSNNKPVSTAQVWTSADFTPVMGVENSVTHGLTLDLGKAKAEVLAKCTIANNGYAVGDVVSNFITGFTANYAAPLAVTLNATTISAITVYNNNISVRNKTTGVVASVPFSTGWVLFFRITY